MMLPIVAFGWTEFAEGFVSALALVTGWKRYQEDPIADLTMRLRHPIRWTVLHPLQAMGRTLR